MLRHSIIVGLVLVEGKTREIEEIYLSASKSMKVGLYNTSFLQLSMQGKLMGGVHIAYLQLAGRLAPWRCQRRGYQRRIRGQCRLHKHRSNHPRHAGWRQSSRIRKASCGTSSPPNY